MSYSSSEHILEKLVGFPTVSRDSNLELIAYIRDYLADYGVDAELIPGEKEDKANLHARIGPDMPGGIMLSGHTDVVPIDGQQWNYDAFCMTHESGRLFGRGTTDMKGFISCVLAMVPEAVKRSLERPIHLAFSYDEEIGCIGVRRMLDLFEGAPLRPDFCIVGEPTGMQVGIAHKGKLAATCTCTGVEAHSALPDKGLNAIHLATEMVQSMRGIQERLRHHGTQDHHYEVPWTTIHVGTIEGGTALNIIPRECRFQFEIRNLQGDEPSDLLQEIRAIGDGIVGQYHGIFPQAAISISVDNHYPSLDTRPEEAVVKLVQGVLQTDDFIKLAFGTEGGLFQQRLGVPTVICGPGSMDQGHKPDEFITRDQMARCDDFLGKLLDQVSNSRP